MLRLAVIFLLSFLFSSTVFSQETVLNYFYVNNTGNSVLLEWEIKGGNTCNGIKIWRSADGINFEEIGEVAGDCGSVDFAIAYDFTDNQPMENRVNYYRVELVNLFVSEIRSVFFLSPSRPWAVTYDASGQTITLWFDNPSSETCTLEFCSADGRLKSRFFSSASSFTAGRDLLKAGLVVFTIHRPGMPSIRGSLFLP